MPCHGRQIRPWPFLSQPHKPLTRPAFFCRLPVRAATARAAWRPGAGALGRRAG
ncbi:hypothetical protein HMPREF0731_2573, partial [Pseudoroseomonas cervicalis ATCC 49957]